MYQLFSHYSQFQKALFPTGYMLNHLLNKHYKRKRGIQNFLRNHIKNFKCIPVARQNIVNIILEAEKQCKLIFWEVWRRGQWLFLFFLLPSYIYFPIIHSSVKCANMPRLCLRTLKILQLK